MFGWLSSLLHNFHCFIFIAHCYLIWRRGEIVTCCSEFRLSLCLGISQPKYNLQVSFNEISRARLGLCCGFCASLKSLELFSSSPQVASHWLVLGGGGGGGVTRVWWVCVNINNPRASHPVSLLLMDEEVTWKY